MEIEYLGPLENEQVEIEYLGPLTKPEASIGRILGGFWNELKASPARYAESQRAAWEHGKGQLTDDELVNNWGKLLSPVQKGQMGPIVSDLVSRGVPQNEAIKQAVLAVRDQQKKEATEMWSGIADAEGLQMDPKYDQSSGFLEDVSRGIGGSLLPMGATMANPTLGADSMFHVMRGARYKGLTKEGVDPERALQASTASAAMQLPLEAAGNIFQIKKMLGNTSGWRKFMVDVAESMGVEAMTEFAQTYPDELAAIWAKNSDAKPKELWGTVKKQFPQMVNNSLYQGLVGSVSGGIITGGGKSVMSVYDKWAGMSKEDQKAVEDTANKIVADKTATDQEREQAQALLNILHNIGQQKWDQAENEGVRQREQNKSFEDNPIMQDLGSMTEQQRAEWWDKAERDSANLHSEHAASRADIGGRKLKGNLALAQDASEVTAGEWDLLNKIAAPESDFSLPNAEDPYGVLENENRRARNYINEQAGRLNNRPAALPKPDTIYQQPEAGQITTPEQIEARRRYQEQAQQTPAALPKPEVIYLGPLDNPAQEQKGPRPTNQPPVDTERENIDRQISEADHAKAYEYVNNVLKDPDSAGEAYRYALQSFDPSKGTAFPTYAYMVADFMRRGGGKLNEVNADRVDQRSESMHKPIMDGKAENGDRLSGEYIGEKGIINKLDIDGVKEAIKTLPEKQAQALELIYLNDMSQRAAAKEMGVSFEYVRRMHDAGIENLRKHYQNRDTEIRRNKIVKEVTSKPHDNSVNVTEGLTKLPEKVDNVTGKVDNQDVKPDTEKTTPQTTAQSKETPSLRQSAQQAPTVEPAANGEQKGQPESKAATGDTTSAKKPNGLVWIKEQQRPFTSWREITRGKNKGKVAVNLRGREVIVDKSKVVQWPEAGSRTAPVAALQTAPRKDGDKYTAGFSWNSRDGKKTILGHAKGRPVGWLEIEKENSSSKQYIHIDDIAGEIDFDTKQLEQDEKFNAEIKQQQAEEAKERAEYEDVDGFTDGLGDMQKGRVLKTLNKQVRADGKATTIKALIRNMVAEGRIIGEYAGRRTLETLDGNFRDEKDLTKTGIDYAEFLISKRDATPEKLTKEPAKVDKTDQPTESVRAEQTGTNGGIDHSRIKRGDMIKFKLGDRVWNEMVLQVFGDNHGPISNTYQVDAFGDKFIKHEDVEAVKHKNGDTQKATTEATKKTGTNGDTTLYSGLAFLEPFINRGAAAAKAKASDIPRISQQQKAKLKRVTSEAVPDMTEKLSSIFKGVTDIEAFNSHAAGQLWKEAVIRIETEANSLVGRNLSKMEKAEAALSISDRQWAHKNFKQVYEAEGSAGMPTAKLKAYADAWTEVHNELGKIAEDLGVMVADDRFEGGRRPFTRSLPNFFPRSFTKEARDAVKRGRGSVFEAMVQAGIERGVDVKGLIEANTTVDDMRRFGHMENPRIGELPDTVTTKNGETVKILQSNPFDMIASYINGAAHRLAIIRELGQDEAQSIAEEVSTALKSDGLQTEGRMVDDTWAVLNGNLSREERRRLEERGLLGIVRPLESIARLAMLSTATVSQISGWVPMAARGGMWNNVKAMAEVAGEKAGRRIGLDLKSTAELDLVRNMGGWAKDVLGHTYETEDLEGFADFIAKKGLSATGFSASNRVLNQAASLTALNSFIDGMAYLRNPKDSALSRLWGKDAQSVRNQLKSNYDFTDSEIDRMIGNGIDYSDAQAIADKAATDPKMQRAYLDMAQAVQRMVGKTNLYRESILNRPPWMNKRGARMFMTFLSYSRAMGRTLGYSMTEAKRGNLRPIVTLLAGGAIAGGVVDELKKLLFRKDNEPIEDSWDLFKRLMEYELEAATFGLWGVVAQDALWSYRLNDVSMDVPLVEWWFRNIRGVVKAIDKGDPGETYKELARSTPIIKAIDAQFEGPLYSGKSGTSRRSTSRRKTSRRKTSRRKTSRRRTSR